MYELLARTWGLAVLRGVLAVLFGVAAVAWPGITVIALVILFGAYAVVDGVIALAMGASGIDGGRWLLILAGVVGILTGIVTFVWPGITAVVLLVTVAVWALLVGVLSLLSAWRLRGERAGLWLLVVTGLACVALGVLLLLRPTDGAISLIVAIGSLAMVWGVLLVILGLRMRSLSKLPPAGPHEVIP